MNDRNPDAPGAARSEAALFTRWAEAIYIPQGGRTLAWAAKTAAAPMR